MAAPHLAIRYKTACSLARHAGLVALEYFRNRAQLVVELKGPTDYVSHADREVEDVIRRELAANFPDDVFLGEETAAQFTGPVDRCWVVDPIDGTHNFLRGMPYWNVAIAYVENGRTEIGLVYDPPADALYHALRGHGAWCSTLEGKVRLQAAETQALAGSYVALGHHDRGFEPRYFEIRHRMMEAGVAMRNFGSGALQLAHLASGRLDGFIELELAAWDAVAGLLLVEEAGGFHLPFAPSAPTAKAACLGCAPGIGAALTELVGPI